MKPHIIFAIPVILLVTFGWAQDAHSVPVERSAPKCHTPRF